MKSVKYEVQEKQRVLLNFLLCSSSRSIRVCLVLPQFESGLMILRSILIMSDCPRVPLRLGAFLKKDTFMHLGFGFVLGLGQKCSRELERSNDQTCCKQTFSWSYLEKKTKANLKIITQSVHGIIAE